MKYTWLVIGVLAARFLAFALAFPPFDGDLYWQRRLGATILRDRALPRTLGADTFTAPNAPWVPHEWVFAIAAYAGRSGFGWAVLCVACALAAVGALAIACVHARRRGASDADIAMCVAFAGIALFQSFGVRAQVVSWPLLALLLLLLDSDGPWCYGAVAVAAVWSNLHASAILAPIVAALCAVGSAFDERGFGARTRRLALVAATCAVAICLNPFGWELPRYALAVFNDPVKTYTNEWKIPDIDDFSFAAGALPLLLIAMVLGIVRNRPSQDQRCWRDFFVLAAFAFLGLGVVRDITFFAIAALPIVASALTRSAFFAAAAPRVPGRFDRIVALAAAPAAFAIALALCLWIAAVAPPGPKLANAPFGALARIGGEHRVLCGDFAWCALALGVPGESVFLDGRGDPYPRDVWDDYESVILVKPAWSRILDRRGVDSVVVRLRSPLDQALALSSGWRVAYADREYRLWLRSPPRDFRLGARERRVP